VQSSCRARSATRIELFSGHIIRQFVGLIKHGGANSVSTKKLFETPTCAKWNVVTTIYEATAAVRTAAAMHGWCTVIVGDRKTPKNYMRNWNSTKGDTVVFLSVAMQERESLLILATWMRFWLLPSRVSCVLLCPSLLLLLILCTAVGGSVVGVVGPL